MKNLSMIAAMDRNRIIGVGNSLPWHLPDDFAFFKKQTLFKPVIMGRKTFESIGSSPLANRTNIVISSEKHKSSNDLLWFNEAEEALSFAKTLDSNEIMVIGGGKVFNYFMPVANRLYLTWVDVSVEGSNLVYFPKWQSKDWACVFEQKHEADKNHNYSFTFNILEKT